MVSFEWGQNSSYGNATIPQNMIGTGNFSASLSGLSPNITYHYRVKAVGDATVYTSDATFTTLIPPWDVNGDHVTNIQDVVLVGLYWNDSRA